MEVYDGALNPWELVNIVDGLGGVGSRRVIVEQLDVIKHLSRQQDVVHGVEGVTTCGAIEEEGVCLDCRR